MWGGDMLHWMDRLGWYLVGECKVRETEHYQGTKISPHLFKAASDRHFIHIRHPAPPQVLY
jgi:hypothetical protein